MHSTVENYSRTIYTLIGDENYNEALKILSNELNTSPDSTAIHSLMGYCYFQQEEYAKACASYAKLVQLNPNNDQYKLLHAQCLYKTDQYYEAMRVSFGVQSPELKSNTSLLQAAIRYAEEDIQSAKSILAESDQESEDIMLDSAVVLFKEDRFEEALDKYMEIKRLHGFIPEVAYCIALCYYRLNRFSDAIQYIAEIKSNTARTHPELLRSLAGENIDFDIVGKLAQFQDLFLVETFNLLMAIEYDQKHFREAKDALHELPNRNVEELDMITLHNTALVTMEEDPSASFSKLSFLLQQNPPLSETFRNLLLGYCKFEYYTYAADLLAENTELALKTMGQPMLDFLDAVLLYDSSKEEAYRKFDELCKSKADILRRLLNQIEDARKTHDEEQQTQLTLEFEANVGEMIPILMSQAKIFWDLGSYQLVELLLLKYQDFCLDNRAWKLNLAHTYFMQESKMVEAIQCYEPLVLGEQNLLDVEAIIVANLCVAYVVTNQNGLADTIINRLTDEEAQKAKDEPDTKIYHLSILHLVIGTLYCAHKNFEFGIDYVFKAFNPMHTKLNPDTWFYSKKCLCEVLRSMSMRQYIMPDEQFEKICNFLDDVDKNGKKIESIFDMTLMAEEAHENQTISFEARTIKAMLLRLYNF
ncbi:TPR Domain containing protein [Tritrichomonas foetus]|uniref:TPR Domain containing protein n=1 Tax=Tritrichomonas foetus TaxID=1144522 RepID=A0A1J4KKC0_9EUKA|nr:TPR Domain containing protein [Tritrichomonas foetus]|eukprot:OHT11745.1 TPR Domain containing protein [Tritrichomonas foetus]